MTGSGARLTFLGTGTSQGVPIIGCKCDVCRSAAPRDKRFRASVFVEYGGLNILVDAGPDFRMQMIGHEISHLDAILLTHNHKDHTGGLDDVRSLNYIDRRAAEIYCERNVLEDLIREYPYVFKFPKYPGAPEWMLHVIDEHPFILRKDSSDKELVWVHDVGYHYRMNDGTLVPTARSLDDMIDTAIPAAGSASPDSSLRSAPPISRRDCEDKSSHSLHRSGPLPLTSRGWLRSGLARPVSDGEVVIGGYTDAEINYISPTVIDRCGWDHPAMGEEIFGPVLPVITFKDLQTEVIDKVKEGEKPLSLYIFSKNREEIRTVLQQVSFGGGCVNETIMHIGNENMPFGGVGESGIGAYHGRDRFDAFSHKKSMLIKSSWLNFDLLKPPYGKILKLIRKVYK